MNYFFLPKLNGSYHVHEIQRAILPLQTLKVVLFALMKVPSTNLHFIRTTFTSLQVVISKGVFWWWWHLRLFNQRKCIKLVLSRWLSPITFLNRSTHSRLRNNKSVFWHLCFSPELACLHLLLPHFFTCVCIWKLCGTHMSAPTEYQNKSKSWSNYPIRTWYLFLRRDF